MTFGVSTSWLLGMSNVTVLFQVEITTQHAQTMCMGNLSHLSDFVKGRIIGMKDMGASYQEITQTVGSSIMTAERVVARWSQETVWQEEQARILPEGLHYEKIVGFFD